MRKPCLVVGVAFLLEGLLDLMLETEHQDHALELAERVPSPRYWPACVETCEHTAARVREEEKWRAESPMVYIDVQGPKRFRYLMVKPLVL